MAFNYLAYPTVKLLATQITANKLYSIKIFIKNLSAETAFNSLAYNVVMAISTQITANKLYNIKNFHNNFFVSYTN
jgi:hypothetical protein